MLIRITLTTLFASDVRGPPKDHGEDYAVTINGVIVGDAIQDNYGCNQKDVFNHGRIVGHATQNNFAAHC